MTDSSDELGRAVDTREPSSITSSLLTRVKAESPEAWRRLVGLFGPLVYQWCRKKGLQAADAADVTQEVFRAVAMQIGGFRRDRPGGTFRGWLWTITRGKIADYWRQQDKQFQATGGSSAQHKIANLPTAETCPSDATPPPQAPHSLMERALELVQSNFEKQTWQAFWRVAVDDCKPSDVAEELAMSVNAVYLAKSRVLRWLREELGDLFD